MYEEEERWKKKGREGIKSKCYVETVMKIGERSK
jgi:hypothetical protein